MKSFFYMLGILLAGLSVGFLYEGNTRIKGGVDAHAAESTTSFMIFSCQGADVFFTPTRVEATIGYDTAGSSGAMLGSVAVTNPVMGGTATPVVSAAGTSLTPGLGYAVFASPKMRHVYSCQGVDVEFSDLNWKYVADNPDMYVGHASSGTTSEPSFTEVTAIFQNVYINMPRDPQRPFFIWEDGAFNLILKGSVASNAVAGVAETMDVTLMSAPHP